MIHSTPFPETSLDFWASYARTVAREFTGASDDELRGWVGAWLARLNGFTNDKARAAAAEAVRRFRSEEQA